MAVIRWIFTDTVTDVTHTLEINPDSATGPTREKKIGYSAAAGPNGTVLVYEGREDPPEFSFSGKILTSTHYLALEEWYLRRVPVRITDDLGRDITGYIKSFAPKRERSALYPWKHTFDMSMVVMAIENPT